MGFFVRTLSFVLILLVTTSAGLISPTEKIPAKPLRTLTKSEIKKLTAPQMETYLGRSMTGMEKLAFKLHKKKFVKYARMHEEGKTNTFAILALATSWVPGLGVVFGIIGLSQIKRRKEKGRGLAWAGIAISGIMLLWVLMMASFPG